jgi:hypothetical protein
MLKKIIARLIPKSSQSVRNRCQDCRFVSRIDGKFRCTNADFPYSYVKNNDFCILFEPYQLSQAVEHKAIKNYLERCLKSEATSQ